MPRITTNGADFRPFCGIAERLLISKDLQDIDRVRVDADLARHVETMEKTGRRTMAKIYIGETHVGGGEDLAKLDRAGILDGLLQANN